MMKQGVFGQGVGANTECLGRINTRFTSPQAPSPNQCPHPHPHFEVVIHYEEDWNDHQSKEDYIACNGVSEMEKEALSLMHSKSELHDPAMLAQTQSNFGLLLHFNFGNRQSWKTSVKV